MSGSSGRNPASMSTRASPASTSTGCMAPLILAFLEPPKRLPASVTNTPSSRMWTRNCPTSKLVSLANLLPLLVVSSNNSGPGASALCSGDSTRQTYTGRCGSSRKHPLLDALPQGPGERAWVLEEVVDGCVARKGLYQRTAGFRVFLAGFEDGLEQGQVGHQVDERVPGEVLAGPPVPELSF